MKDRKNIDIKKFIQSEQSEIVFSFNKKIIPIFRLDLKVGHSNRKVDVGQVLHDTSEVFLSKKI